MCLFMVGAKKAFALALAVFALVVLAYANSNAAGLAAQGSGASVSGNSASQSVASVAATATEGSASDAIIPSSSYVSSAGIGSPLANGKDRLVASAVSISIANPHSNSAQSALECDAGLLVASRVTYANCFNLSRLKGVRAQPAGLGIASPLNATYASARILVNLSGEWESAWFFNGTGNETYVQPVFREFAQGSNALFAWGEDAQGNIGEASVEFFVGAPARDDGEYDDVYFNSSFQSGNLANVSYVGGNAGGERFYQANLNYSDAVFGSYHWWFFFRLQNASGKNVHINLTNLKDEDFGDGRWQNLRPRYSYDFGEGNVHAQNANWSAGEWDALPTSSREYSREGKWYSFNITPTQQAVWVAPNEPYTIARRDKFLSSISASPYVNISTIAVSPHGINVSAVTITDWNSTGGKAKVYVIAQQHSNEETQGSWATEGAIEFLLNESDASAAEIRRKLVFKFVPILNVDGTYEGVGRFTPPEGGSQYDPNREWNKTRAGAGYALVRQAYLDIGNFAPNASMDWHGTITENVNYHYNDGLYDGDMRAFLQSITARWERVNEGYDASAATAEGMSHNARVGHGAHPSSLLEWTVAAFSDGVVPSYADWKRHGVGISRAVFDYYNTTRAAGGGSGGGSGGGGSSGGGSSGGGGRGSTGGGGSLGGGAGGGAQSDVRIIVPLPAEEGKSSGNSGKGNSAVAQAIEQGQIEAVELQGKVAGATESKKRGLDFGFAAQIWNSAGSGLKFGRIGNYEIMIGGMLAVTAASLAVAAYQVFVRKR